MSMELIFRKPINNKVTHFVVKLKNGHKENVMQKVSLKWFSLYSS